MESVLEQCLSIFFPPKLQQIVPWQASLVLLNLFTDTPAALSPHKNSLVPKSHSLCYLETRLPIKVLSAMPQKL